MRPWADVIDRIGVTLAASRDAATRPGEAAKARRLADDAYWVEFESSDMETAVNKYLGFGRARELERQFHAISMAARDVAGEAPAGRRSWPNFATRCFSTCRRLRPRSMPRELPTDRGSTLVAGHEAAQSDVAASPMNDVGPTGGRLAIRGFCMGR